MAQRGKGRPSRRTHLRVSCACALRSCAAAVLAAFSAALRARRSSLAASRANTFSSLACSRCASRCSNSAHFCSRCASCGPQACAEGRQSPEMHRAWRILATCCASCMHNGISSSKSGTWCLVSVGSLRCDKHWRDCCGCMIQVPLTHPGALRSVCGCESPATHLLAGLGCLLLLLQALPQPALVFLCARQPTEILRQHSHGRSTCLLHRREIGQ